MSARIYGHNDGTASLEVLRAIYANNPDGTPLTVVRCVDRSPMADGQAFVEVSFTPPALRALHVAIGIRLVETDRLQTGRPANLVTAHREDNLTSYHDVAADERVAWVQRWTGALWAWSLNSGPYAHGSATTRELAEADVAALLRARGYVVEGG